MPVDQALVSAEKPTRTHKPKRFVQAEVTDAFDKATLWQA
jgi:hypothetical protein